MPIGGELNVNQSVSQFESSKKVESLGFTVLPYNCVDEYIQYPHRNKADCQLKIIGIRSPQTRVIGFVSRKFKIKA